MTPRPATTNDGAIVDLKINPDKKNSREKIFKINFDCHALKKVKIMFFLFVDEIQYKFITHKLNKCKIIFVNNSYFSSCFRRNVIYG